MKFSSILSLFAAAVSTVSAFETTSEPKPIGILVGYSIVGSPDIKAGDVATWVNEDTVVLNYQIQNNEEEDITIIGVTGSYRDPISGEVKTNLTHGRVDSLIIEPGTSGSFEQEIPVNLIPGNYQLVPQIFVAHEGQVKVLSVRSQLLTVDDKPISIFDPRLLLLELILIASLAGLGYLGYDIWGRQYFQGVVPVKAATRKAGSPSSEGSSRSNTPSGSSYDVNWIPEGHLKKTKKAN
ncbi:Increased recombination centers protein 22 [Spathaspora sp. JA1]|nr:Increased recombination centers protein 22 [Spathaspora sp. JA1]